MFLFSYGTATPNYNYLLSQADYIINIEKHMTIIV
jgi:hypothetical protein